MCEKSTNQIFMRTQQGWTPQILIRSSIENLFFESNLLFEFYQPVYQTASVNSNRSETAPRNNTRRAANANTAR